MLLLLYTRVFLRVLGPMLFTMYIKPLSAIIESRSIMHHSIADDIQLQMSTPLTKYLSYFTLCSHSLVMSKLGQLGTCLHLMKTRQSSCLSITRTRTRILHNLLTSVAIGNAQIPFKQSVKNLGFTLSCCLSMNAHVCNIARKCYSELRRLASIRGFLTSTATSTLVSAFVLSRIDYCNSLLFDSTHDVTSHLQRMQNYAARVILRLPKSSNITMHLKSLHWLPVKVKAHTK